MNVLLIGASGTIGKAVANLFTQQGHQVIGASRSTQPSLDFTDLESLDAFYEQMPEVDAILAIGGDAAFSSLDQLTASQIEVTLSSKLMGQINALRKGITKIRPNGAFVMTGGILAYTPWPNTSMVAMVNAGLEGFVRGAALEMTEGRRVVIVHPPLVAETASMFGMDATQFPSAAVIAQTYLDAVEKGQNGTAIFTDGHAPVLTAGPE